MYVCMYVQSYNAISMCTSSLWCWNKNRGLWNRTIDLWQSWTRCNSLSTYILIQPGNQRTLP